MEDDKDTKVPEDQSTNNTIIIKNLTLAQKEMKIVAFDSWDKLTELDILSKKLNKELEESKKNTSSYQLRARRGKCFDNEKIIISSY